jgi:hypothetical protein
MGATGKAARGNSSIEKITAPGEDDMPKSLDKIRRGDRVDHYEAMRGPTDSREIPVPNSRPTRARIHSVRAVVCFK